MAKITRRSFLQAGSVAAAATVLSGCTTNLQRVEYLESYSKPPEEGLPGEDLWYASTCRQCQAGCGIIVRVSNGRARKIEGNPQHPVNRGKLCARGQAALQELYDPDRLQSAVTQKERVSLVFEPALWENALYSLAEQLRRVEPGQVAFLGGNLATHQADIATRFMEALGGLAPLNYSLADELDGRSGLMQASQEIFGQANGRLPYYDLAHADVVFSFGANLLETWLSPVSQSRAYADMRRQPLGKRGYWVQFEARMSSTAACADKWVPVQPGTEGLVALALGQLISEQIGQNNDRYSGVDVAGIAEISGVPLEELEHLAHLFARYERPVAIAGNALAGQHNGHAGVAAVQSLNDLLGRFGQEGGVYWPGSSNPHDPDTFADLMGLIERMKAGEVRLLMIQGFNPVFELPPESGFVQALDNVTTVVYFGTAVDETAARADMILPDHTSLESWGWHVPTIADRQVHGGMQPVMRPLYDTRSTVDVLLALADRLNLDSLSWSNEVDYLEAMVESLELSWAAWRREGGWWATEPALFAPTAEFGQLPVVLPVFEGERDEYEFHLHIYPSVALGDGRGANKAWLQETPDPMTTVAWQTSVEINPETAHHLGLEDNDIVKVISPAGEIEAMVYKYHGIPMDVVAIAVGRGHENYGRFAKDFGSNPIKLLVPAVNQHTGTLAWGATRVKLEKTEETRELPRLESPEGVEYLRGGGEEH